MTHWDSVYVRGYLGQEPADLFFVALVREDERGHRRPFPIEFTTMIRTEDETKLAGSVCACATMGLLGCVIG